MWKKGCLVLFGLLCLFTFVGMVVIGPTVEPDPPPTYENFNAEQLIKTFAENPVRAEKEFEGKTFRLTGIVRGFDQGPAGGVYVNLSEGENTTWVQAKMGNGESVDHLTVGSRATFVCEGDDMTPMQMPAVKGCRLSY